MRNMFIKNIEKLCVMMNILHSKEETRVITDDNRTLYQKSYH